VKSNLMSSRFGLTSARRSTVLPCGSQAILTVDAAAQLQQDQSVQILVQAANWFAPVAFPAMRVPAIPAPEGGSYATTKHIGNGGLRGPQPWRHPPVIT
jgi:hypothetical protein